MLDLLRAGAHVHVAGSQGAMPLAVRAALDDLLHAADGRPEGAPVAGSAPGLPPSRFHVECW